MSPSPMTRAETEKALVEDSAGRASLVKDWRSIFADGSVRRKEGYLEVGGVSCDWELN